MDRDNMTSRTRNSCRSRRSHSVTIASSLRASGPTFIKQTPVRQFTSWPAANATLGCVLSRRCAPCCSDQNCVLCGRRQLKRLHCSLLGYRLQQNAAFGLRRGLSLLRSLGNRNRGALHWGNRRGAHSSKPCVLGSYCWSGTLLRGALSKKSASPRINLDYGVASVLLWRCRFRVSPVSCLLSLSAPIRTVQKGLLRAREAGFVCKS